MHAGFINDAKEWAGELLSGQTKVTKLQSLHQLIIVF